MRAYAVFFALLIISAQFAAGDSPSEALRAFCMNMLGKNETAQQEAVEAEPLPAAQSNFSHGANYYEALSGLSDANASVSRLRSAGLPFLQAQDTYLSALQWFEGQAALELIGGQAEYGYAFERVRQIKDMERSTFSTSDELSALSQRLAGASQDANLTRAAELFLSAKGEFSDGRLEEANSLVDQAYQEISDAESQAALSNTLLQSAQRNIETFLKENWQNIAAAATIIAILLFAFQKRIRRFLVRSRINSLTAERAVLENMLRTLQMEYFDKRSISEMSFHVKTKKFGDLIRNINRQLPLLKEELKRI